MGKIVINKERCKGCDICVHTCPYQLIHLSDEINRMGYHFACFVDETSKCTGCALCAEMCPHVAIEVYK